MCTSTCCALAGVPRGSGRIGTAGTIWWRYTSGLGTVPYSESKPMCLRHAGHQILNATYDTVLILCYQCWSVQVSLEKFGGASLTYN